MVEVGEYLFMFEVKSLNRVVDIVIEDWFNRWKVIGFKVYLFIVWILEGFLYYL